MVDVVDGTVVFVSEVVVAVTWVVVMVGVLVGFEVLMVDVGLVWVGFRYEVLVVGPDERVELTILLL